MRTRRIGDTTVGAVGLGAMPMSLAGRPDEARSVATIHAALDAGVTLIDTADAYCIDERDVGHNESLIATALASYGGNTDAVLVATKGGHTRPRGSWGLDGSPRYLRRACEASLERLGVDAIGLYQFHRPDPRVPFEESVGALRELLDQGKIRMAGVSNTNPARSGPRTRSSAAGWRRCRTSSRRSSAAASRSAGCATSWASPSCRGARSAASAAPARSARGTLASTRSPGTAG